MRLICHFVNLVLVQEIAATPGADATTSTTDDSTTLLLTTLLTDYLPSRPTGDRGHVADEPRRLDRACRLGMGAAACSIAQTKVLSVAKTNSTL